MPLLWRGFRARTKKGSYETQCAAQRRTERHLLGSGRSSGHMPDDAVTPRYGVLQTAITARLSSSVVWMCENEARVCMRSFGCLLVVFVLCCLMACQRTLRRHRAPDLRSEGVHDNVVRLSDANSFVHQCCKISYAMHTVPHLSAITFRRSPHNAPTPCNLVIWIRLPGLQQGGRTVELNIRKQPCVRSHIAQHGIRGAAE